MCYIAFRFLTFQLAGAYNERLSTSAFAPFACPPSPWRASCERETLMRKRTAMIDFIRIYGQMFDFKKQSQVIASRRRRRSSALRIPLVSSHLTCRRNPESGTISYPDLPWKSSTQTQRSIRLLLPTYVGIAMTITATQCPPQHSSINSASYPDSSYHNLP